MKQHSTRISIELVSAPLPTQALPSDAVPTTICATQHAPMMTGMSACSEAALPASAGSADTGSTGQRLHIDAQARTVIDSIGCNTRARGLLLDAWGAYRSFARERGTLPERLEGITPADLARFVVHARSVQEDIDALLMMLAMLGSLLLHTGHNQRALTSLTAAVRRTRVRNGRNGKYAYERRLAKAPSGPHADSGNEL